MIKLIAQQMMHTLNWFEDGLGGIVGEDEDHELKQDAFIRGAEWVLESLKCLKNEKLWCIHKK